MNAATHFAAEGVEGISATVYPAYADLAGRSVLVTGGATGIGAYLVHAFAQVGARVAFISQAADPGEALCAAVAATGADRPLFLAADLRDVAALARAMEAAAEAHGDIGVLVNNAARDDRHDLTSLGLEAWEDAMSINLRPHFFAAQQAVAGMRRSGGGAIINIGSNSALLGLAGYPAYVAAKAGVIGLTRALSRELGPDGVRVNALIPGWVLTRRQRQLWANPEAVAACLDQQALKRTVTAEDIAHSALFLASAAAAMITGQSLVVDGGRVML